MIFKLELDLQVNSAFAMVFRSGSLSVSTNKFERVELCRASNTEHTVLATIFLEAVH
jgi:hypothetical protein